MSVNEHASLSMVFWIMVFNATFNTISVISWRSVLLVYDGAYSTLHLDTYQNKETARSKKGH